MVFCYSRTHSLRKQQPSDRDQTLKTARRKYHISYNFTAELNKWGGRVSGKVEKKGEVMRLQSMEAKEKQLKEKQNLQATENQSHQESWPLAAGGIVLWESLYPAM